MSLLITAVDAVCNCCCSLYGVCCLILVVDGVVVCWCCRCCCSCRCYSCVLFDVDVCCALMSVMDDGCRLLVLLELLWLVAVVAVFCWCVLKVMLLFAVDCYCCVLLFVCVVAGCVLCVVGVGVCC